ncbi:hypothetical protein AgCh_036739 [Apium graveolens]
MISTGADLGSYWTAKLTWPRRFPNRVPVTLRPRVGVMERWEGMVSHLQVGRIMGKVMRLMSDRKKAEMIRRGSGSHVGSRDDLCGGAAVAAACSGKF